MLTVVHSEAEYWCRQKCLLEGLEQCNLLQEKYFRNMNSYPHHSTPFCTWALSKLSRWTLAEEWSPAGFVTDTLHVLWTWLLHARIVGPRAQSSCDKGGTRMISTKGITLHSREHRNGSRAALCRLQVERQTLHRSQRVWMGFDRYGYPPDVSAPAQSLLPD